MLMNIVVAFYKPPGCSFEPSDSFVGFQNDTPAAVVFKASKMIGMHDSKQVWH